MEEVYVPKNPHEKAMQRALIQYREPKNYELVREALVKGHREDLIGFGTNCLLRPRHSQNSDTLSKQTGNRKKKTIRNVHKSMKTKR